MRFIVPFFALVAATVVTAQQCTVCRDSIPPGVAEIGWGLVFNRTIGDNIMFCGRPQAFCEYTLDNGTFIENAEAYYVCPKQIELGKCQ
ncbi:hypothetical protein B0H13DRAFT_2304431 [Mycena leptocephala]|nr:hypothetical protein B0H13DRAFT_2304431 [Mycena leptocephala]